MRGRIPCHDCGLHIAHVHKNLCGSRDFPNPAFLFLNCTSVSFFAASFRLVVFCCLYLFILCLFETARIQQEKGRLGNEATVYIGDYTTKVGLARDSDYAQAIAHSV